MQAPGTEPGPPMRGTYRNALALAAGCAAILSFAPFDFLPAGIVAFALLVHLWLGAPTPRAAFWSGWWFGLGLFGAGVSWVYVSLHEFGAMPALVAGIATLGFCAFLALFPALAGWLQARWRVAEWLRGALVIPALWTFFEWLRGWVLSGFPWLSAGYAAPGWPLEGYAPLGGTYLASLAMLACAGFLRQSVAGPRRGAAALALATLFALGAALRAVEWTEPRRSVAVALLQGNVPQALKFDAGRYADTLATYERLAAGSHARLIVLPETALPRFLDDIDPAYLRRLEAIARRNHGNLLLGVPTREPSGRYYNSVLSLGTSPSQRYHKVHLVPFGEFVPPGFGWVQSMLSIPLSGFSAGSRDQPPLDLAGERVAVNVCYEDAFGEEIIRQLPRATLLVNVSNVAWFGDSLAPAQHLQIARMRALETGRTMLTATNSGITAAIDRDGRVIARLPQYTEARLEVAARSYAGATPYTRVGDLGALAAIALMLGAPLLAQVLRKR